MTESLDRIFVLCPGCGGRLRLPAEKIGIVGCPLCQRDVAISTMRRKLPAVGILFATMVFLLALLIPSRGNPLSSLVAFGAATSSYLGVRFLSRVLREYPVDLKILAEGQRALLILTLVAFPFFAATLLALVYGPRVMGSLHIGEFLRLQNLLESSDAEYYVKLISRAIGLIAGIVGLLLYLFGKKSAAGGARKQGKSLGLLATGIAIALACVMSFSVVAGYAGESTYLLTKKQAKEERRLLIIAIEKVHETVRIVWGDRLAAAYIEHQLDIKLAPTPATSDNLFGIVGEPNCELKQNDSDGCAVLAAFAQTLKPAPMLVDEATPNAFRRIAPDGATGPTIREKVNTWKEAAKDPGSPTSETHPTTEDVSTLSLFPKRDFEKKASEAWARSKCDEIRGDPKTLKEVMTLIADVIWNGAGLSAPSIDVSESFGGFLQEYINIISKDRVKEAMKGGFVSIFASLLKRGRDDVYSESEEIPSVAQEEIDSSKKWGKKISSEVSKQNRERFEIAQEVINKLKFPAKGEPSTQSDETAPTSRCRCIEIATGTDVGDCSVPQCRFSSGWARRK